MIRLKRPRNVLFLSTILLLYHWVFGLPSFDLVVQRYLIGGETLGSDNGPTSPGIRTGYDISIPWKKRIVAVGDLHGDLAHTLRVLRAAKIVDHRAQWIGKTATLIQTGDIVDRGTDTIALYRLFDTLRVQAAQTGGEVISLLGNHEVRKVFQQMPVSLRNPTSS